MPSRLTVSIGGLFALTVAVLVAGQQPPQPVFRTAVDLVQLDVRVVDANGEFVRDLTQDAFRVFEDNVAQTLSAFSLVDIPIGPSTALTLAGQRI
jgi:hypothetical protein